MRSLLRSLLRSPVRSPVLGRKAAPRADPVVLNRAVLEAHHPLTTVGNAIVVGDHDQR